MKVKKKFLVIFMSAGLIITPLGLTGNAIKAEAAKKVVVDAGHGGKDSGATANGLREKDLTLIISRKVNQKLLNNFVVETKMTRNSDIFVELKERTDMANKWGANLFLSVHINAGGGTGYEDYIHSTAPATSEDKKVQAEINKEINQVLQEYGQKNRGQKKADFHVLRESKMTSVLLEIMFIDNKNDAALLKNEMFLEDMAEAIATGAGHALNLPEKTTNPPAPVEPIQVSKASGTYVVTADSLNARTGDGVSYPLVGYLKKGEEIKVTGKTSKGWYQFTFKGKTAYVSGTYLKVKPVGATAAPKPAPAPKPTPKPVPKPQPQQSNQINVTKASGTYIVTSTSLNIRSGNGTNFKTIGYLQKNNQVTVTGKTSNNWYQIKHNDKIGYVSGSHLKVKPTPKPTVNSIKVTKISGQYKVTASSLNVRSGNGTNFKSIGYLKKNKQVAVTGKTSNGWYQIKHNGKVGYVSGKHLKSVPEMNSGIYKVTAIGLNVRSGNGASHSRIGYLIWGNKVTVTGKTSNGWYQINFKGKTGYVNGQYLKK